MYRLQGQVSLLDYLVEGRFEEKVLQPYLNIHPLAHAVNGYMATDSDGDSDA